MKRINFIILCLFIVFGMTCLISCEKDEDDENVSLSGSYYGYEQVDSDFFTHRITIKSSRTCTWYGTQKDPSCGFYTSWTTEGTYKIVGNTVYFDWGPDTYLKSGTIMENGRIIMIEGICFIKE